MLLNLSFVNLNDVKVIEWTYFKYRIITNIAAFEVNCHETNPYLRAVFAGVFSNICVGESAMS